jgi:hypothetical protein
MLSNLLSESVLVAALLAILALVFMDLVTRVAVSVARGVFEWGKVLDFLRTNVVPYVLAWGAIEALMYAAGYVAFPPEVLAPFAGLAAIIYALILAKLIGSILSNLKDLGVPSGA